MELAITAAASVVTFAVPHERRAPRGSRAMQYWIAPHLLSSSQTKMLSVN